ncbi:sigma-70 family RNA polymerase sigma factor [Geomicrobium sp. JCM 19037]|uniref:sigma-70 family RNA polymerase sigma factor n=1 Tax=Geomicrobium sp. JCM 19037 TaxID=1460634 RepID=UPI00187C36E4|nr:sigma-70 family RNA polymerase sigma factor [Geomicrobium sp. JCM 19037]
MSHESIRQQFTFEVVYEHYTRLIKATLHRLQIYQNHEEFMQVGYIGLWKAYETHDAARGPFPAYAKLCVKHEMLTHLRKESTYMNRHQPTEFGEHDDEMGHVDEMNDDEWLQQILAHLSDKESIWVVEHSVNDLPPRMIAEKHKVTVDAVKDWRKRALKKLRTLTFEL